MIARIRAALRRQANPYRVELSEPYVLGGLTIDYAERRVTVAGRPIELTTAEYELIFELSVNAGRVLTHDQLLRRVWGLTNTGDVRVIRTLVRRLRRKLDDDARSPTYIFAERRVGYRMPKGQRGTGVTRCAGGLGGLRTRIEAAEAADDFVEHLRCKEQFCHGDALVVAVD